MAISVMSGRKVTNIDRRLCRRVVPLKVVVLGMARTGTESMRTALEQLGFSDAYHMKSVYENPPDIELWRQAFLAKFRGQGKPFEKEQWDQLLGHCQAVTDLPTSAFIPELIAAYPDVKLILTQREENSWYASCQRTIQRSTLSPAMRVGLTHNPVEKFKYFPPITLWSARPPTLTGSPYQILSMLAPQFSTRYRDFHGLVLGCFFDCPPELWPKPEGKRIWIEHYRRAHDEARALVPPHRRLEYNVAQGWGPLCGFLGVEVPVGTPFPKMNDSASFNDMISAVKWVGAKMVARRWGPALGVLAAAGLGLWWAVG